jgi:MaoC like domain
MLGTYAKAAAALVPGASRLPFVAGGGEDVPDLTLTREGVEVDRDRLAAYAKVCGFRLRDELPATYPHILAFPLHMQLMTDGSFPFPAVGLVHLANRIDVRRPLDAGEPLDIAVRPTAVEPHPKGRTFSIVTEVSAGGERVWEETSTMLRRGGGSGEGDGAAREREEPPEAAAEWKLDGGLGRRYAGVSGDRNPIHLHPFSARLFGFPRPIAHGMWTKARCLAALEQRLGDKYTVEVAFKRPILLPTRVGFGVDGERFAVRSGAEVHLEGTVSAER